MANFELPMGKTAFLAIHTVDKAGDVVPAPVGDVFFASSADETMIVASVELSGPLQGAPELKMVSMALGVGIAVTISDSAGLQTDTILVDVVADLTPSAITVDEANAVFVPNA